MRFNAINVMLVLLSSLLTINSVNGQVIREKTFKMNDLKIESIYQDPSLVHQRLKDSRILPFKFTITNESDSIANIDPKSFKLEISVKGDSLPLSLEQANVDFIMEEIQRTDGRSTLMKFMRKIGKGSSADWFHSKAIEAYASRIEMGLLKPAVLGRGESAVGEIYFKLPEERKSVEWSLIRFNDDLQAVEMKGVPIYIRTDESSLWDKIQTYLQTVFIGDRSPFEKSYALLVSISKYKNLDSLSAPPIDVKRMVDLLEKQGFDEIHWVTEEDVTKYGLSHPEDYFTEKVTANDRFVFYYSGHGTAFRDPITNRMRGYLPLVDEEKNNYGNSIPMDELVSWFRKLQARHLLVILDCCFSGQAIKDRTQFTEDGSDKTFEIGGFRTNKMNRYLLKSKYLLMAGKENQLSISAKKGETKWGGGSLFTDAIINGVTNIDSVDLNRDNLITIKELHRFLEDYVSKIASMHSCKGLPRGKCSLDPKLKDIGQFGSGDGQFFFIRQKDNQ